MGASPALPGRSDLTSDDPIVQSLLDRQAVHDVQMNYARGIDQRDWPMVRAVFAEDGLEAKYAVLYTDVKSVVRMVTGTTRYHSTYHFMGNQLVDVLGDEATMHTLAQMSHKFTLDGQEFAYNPVHGQYVDRLRRTEQGWVVYRRKGPGEVDFGSGTGALTGGAGTAGAGTAVGWLVDRAQVHDVLMRLALAIEHQDVAGFDACYAPEFRLEDERGTTTDADGRPTPPQGDGVTFARHLLGNLLVDVDSDGDHATVEAYAMVTRTHDDPLTGLAHTWTDPAARLSFRLVRHAGGWLVSDQRTSRGPLRPSTPVPSSDDPAVRHLLDRAAIADTITRFAVATDERDYGNVRACLTPDVRFSLGERSLSGADAVVSDLRTSLERYPVTNHFLGNHLAAVDGDSAVAETYAYVTHQPLPGAPFSDWAEGAVRYVDTLVRADVGWLIAARTRTSNRTDIPEHSIRSPLKEPW